MGLYGNYDKIDEVETDVLWSEVEISLYFKAGILYYGKWIGKNIIYSMYNPTNGKIDLFRPDIFSNTENYLLDISDTWDIFFENNKEIFVRTRSGTSRIASKVDYPLGIIVGNHYYHTIASGTEDSEGRTPWDLYEDDTLIHHIKAYYWYTTFFDSDEERCNIDSDVDYCINNRVLLYIKMHLPMTRFIGLTMKVLIFLPCLEMKCIRFYYWGLIESRDAWYILSSLFGSWKNWYTRIARISWNLFRF